MRRPIKISPGEARRILACEEPRICNVGPAIAEVVRGALALPRCPGAQIARYTGLDDYFAASSAGFSKIASSTLPFTLVSVYVVTIVSASPKAILFLVGSLTGPKSW